MPRINLLPWRAELRKKRQRDFAVAALGAVLAAMAMTFVLHLMLSGWIDAQKEKNELLKSEIAQLDKQITEILGLKTQKQRLIARMEIIEKLQRSRPEVVHLFDQLVQTMPDGVYLTGIKQNNKRLELQGIAQSSTRVAAFMRNIEDSQWMANPSIEKIETRKDSAQGSEFVLFADQVGVQLPEQGAK